MIVLDYRDRRPLYEQVVERFQELMFNGVLPQDLQLPPVRSLATELSISPNTVQHTYGELERQGYIYSTKGKGNFAADSSHLRTNMLGEQGIQSGSPVSEGMKVGITEENMTGIIEKEHRGYMAERGEGCDRNSESDQVV